MKLRLTLGALSLGAVLALSGCGSSSSSSSDPVVASDKTRLNYVKAMGVSFEHDMTALTTAWTSDDEEEATAIAAFKGLSNANAAAALITGAIGIADEVGNAKIADPLGGGTPDTTKVESQFSWNSSADFYNNIYSVKKLWDNGLKSLATIAGADTGTVDTTLATALTDIAAISGLDVAKTIAGTAVISQENAFRNKLTTGNAAIVLAQGSVQALFAALEAVQTSMNAAPADINTDAASAGHITSAANAIKATYVNLGTNATALKEAIDALSAGATAANVTAARTAWRLVRANWESSEAYIVATAPSLGAATDGNTDSWPVTSKAAIESNLANWDGDIYTIVTTDGETKGFHTIEYLLFGDGTAVESPAAAVTRLKK